MKCPNELEHNTEADHFSYTGWHEWAEKKSKTHEQHKCTGCGLYAIWKPIKNLPS